MSITVMKQALEALKKARRKILTPEECHAAIMSISQVIADAEKPIIKSYLEKDNLEQEPVAMQMDVIVANLVREGINKHRARELAEHFIKHTPPPQRQPLTRRQIREIEVDVSLNPSFDYITPAEQLCRAIEAAHGIKENT